MSACTKFAVGDVVHCVFPQQRLVSGRIAEVLAYWGQTSEHTYYMVGDLWVDGEHVFAGHREALAYLDRMAEGGAE